jgi:polysaccharide pyruvyl transferase CsaB
MNVVVAAWIGSTNLGDELIFRALVNRLRERDVDITAVSVDPEGTARDHAVAAVHHLHPFSVMQAIRKCDRLIFGGGGILQDETGHWNLPYHLSRMWMARATRTPVGIFGIGVGALNTRSGRFLVRHSLSGEMPTSVRDEDSATRLADLGLATPITAADPAFSLPTPAVTMSNRFAVCLRPPLGPNRLLPASLSARSAVDPAWIDSMARALDSVVETTGLTAHFVAFQTDRDHAVHLQVAEHMKHESSLATATLDTVLDEIAGARVVIAMRYHGGVTAAVAERPVVLLPYSPKVRSLAADLESGAVIAPVDSALLPAAVMEVMADPRPLDERINRLRLRERRNDEVLDRLLESR